MRTLRRLRPLAASLTLTLAALGGCGSSSPPTLPDGGPVPPGATLCTKSSQCPTGQGCIDNLCTPLPCGGCDSDQVCVGTACVPAQGAPCPSVGGCPEGYECNSSHVCSTPCTIDSDCSTGLVCNSNSGTCAQCIFNSNCASVQGKPVCDPTSGNCVACLAAIDCTSTLGAGHFCDTTTHTCQMGCESNGDCNLSNGERCAGATATAPGRCIQCTAATETTDCAAGAPACDATGHCRQCTADRYCGPMTPRCDTSTDTCVACLPANNDAGTDCGYTGFGGHDPHNEEICDAVAKSCVPGCVSDVNCGCPIDPGSGKPTNCLRAYAQEHCDPAHTHSADVPDAGTEGGCVECTSNAHCYCKVSGNQTSTDPSTHLSCAMWPGAGSFNGARCQADACVAGCDADADCPANKLCSLSGPTAHTCVECTCTGRTINDAPAGSCLGSSASCGWCSDPQGSGQLGGCGPVSTSNPNGPKRVCDVKSLTCRLKRQDEQCTASAECGDPQDPTVGQCIPAPFCVLKAHTYTNSTDHYCDPNKVAGRCGVPCNDSQNDQCSSGVSCPNGSICDQATAVDLPPGGVSSGEYCTSTQCSH